MGLFDRIKDRANAQQVKDWKLTPECPAWAKNWTLTSGYPAWLVPESDSGAKVSPTAAMSSAAVYCAVRIIAETVAELPLHLYGYTEDGGKIKAIDNDLYFLLHDEPNPEMTSFTWRETMMTHLLLWGNSYNQIIRDGYGRIKALYPLSPDCVRVDRVPSGRIVYTYTPDEENERIESPVVLQSYDVLHIPGLGFDGIVGYSPLTLARNAIGSAISADKSAGRFYKNAALPSGVIEYDKTLKDAKAFREKFEGTFAGAVNAGKTPVLEDGMKYKPVTMSPQDAQFLETRKFNIDEIARIFRVPPHMLADLEKSSFSNIEQQSLDFVKYCINQWIVRIEQSMHRALLTEDEKRRYFMRFNLAGLERGDYASRMNGYAVGRQNGWLSTNDIRELEDMNRVSAEEGGDLYLINGNMLPLKEAGAYANKSGGTSTENKRKGGKPNA